MSRLICQDEFELMDTVHAARTQKPQHADCHYAVLEFAADGGYLQYLNTYRPRGVNDRDGRKLFRQLLSGLYCLHQTGVACLDVKIDNLLRAKNGDLKITDFGMAQLVAPNVLLTACATGVPQPTAKPVRLFGRRSTVRYMAPEVFASVNVESKYDPFLADVWSCGLVLFVLLLGFPPFEFPALFDERFKHIMDGIHLLELLHCLLACFNLVLVCVSIVLQLLHCLVFQSGVCLCFYCIIIALLACFNLVFVWLLLNATFCFFCLIFPWLCSN